MFGKKRYILLVLIIAFSSIFTWFFLYGDFPHRSPIRAKQVFYMNGSDFHYPVKVNLATSCKMRALDSYFCCESDKM